MGEVPRRVAASFLCRAGFFTSASPFPHGASIAFGCRAAGWQSTRRYVHLPPDTFVDLLHPPSSIVNCAVSPPVGCGPDTNAAAIQNLT